jgi:hypothetical protein
MFYKNKKIQKILIVNSAHDWRYEGDGWEWIKPSSGQITSWDNLVRRGYTSRTCVICGKQEKLPFSKYSKCRRRFESFESGFGGLLFGYIEGLPELVYLGRSSHKKCLKTGHRQHYYRYVKEVTNNAQ